MSKRARLMVVSVLAAATFGCLPNGADSYAERVGEVLARFETTYARTMRACDGSELHCAAAVEDGTSALRRMRSDLVALRAPRHLLGAKRELLDSLDRYSEANEALASTSCARANRDACIQYVKQAKRAVDGQGMAALAPGVAAR